jgi:hypothetical protein
MWHRRDYLLIEKGARRKLPPKFGDPMLFTDPIEKLFALESVRRLLR